MRVKVCSTFVLLIFANDVLGAVVEDAVPFAHLSGSPRRPPPRGIPHRRAGPQTPLPQPTDAAAAHSPQEGATQHEAPIPAEHLPPPPTSVRPSDPERAAYSLLPGLSPLTQPPQNRANFFVNPAATTYDDNFRSLGSVSPCIADIMVPGELPACLQKRAYKRELILVCASFLDTGFLFKTGSTIIQEMLINRLLGYRDLGWEHTIVFSDSREGCDMLEKWMPGSGCIYSSFDQHPDVLASGAPPLGSIGFLWAWRWFLLARSVQLGYNVLMLDLDVEVLQNVYHYVKAPGLAQHNMFSMMEAGHNPAFPVVNGGCNYIQNAIPDGPIAWIGASVLDHTIRWTESDFRNPHNSMKKPGLFEQSMVRDSLCSAMAGRPLFPTSFENPNNSSSFWEVSGMCYHKSDGSLFNYNTVPVPEGEDWSWTLRDFKVDETGLRPGLPPPSASDYNIGYVNLTLPWSHGEWPEHLGGYPFPGPRGAASRVVRELLAMDGTSVWPDEDSPDGSPGTFAANRTSDTWVPMEYSLFDTYGQGGVKGWGAAVQWANEYPPPPLLHVYATGGRSGSLSKMWILKVDGWWHYEVYRVLTPLRPLHCSSDKQPLPRTLGFPLGFRVRTATEKDLQRLHRDIAFAAGVTGRVPVWPEVDCDSEWIEKREEDWSLGPPKTATGVTDRIIHSKGTASDRHCYYLPIVDFTLVGMSLTQPDFAFALSLMEDDHIVGARNTVWWDAAELQAAPASGGPPRAPVNITEAELVKAVQLIGSEHASIYLGRQFRLTDVSTSTQAQFKATFGRSPPFMVDLD